MISIEQEVEFCSMSSQFQTVILLKGKGDYHV
nr:MAG TPA: hypothetical protein [Caudoviricetes sp.]